MSYMEAIGRQAKEAEKKVRILGQRTSCGSGNAVCPERIYFGGK